MLYPRLGLGQNWSILGSASVNLFIPRLGSASVKIKSYILYTDSTTVGYFRGGGRATPSTMVDIKNGAFLNLLCIFFSQFAEIGSTVFKATFYISTFWPPRWIQNIGNKPGFNFEGV